MGRDGTDADSYSNAGWDRGQAAREEEEVEGWAEEPNGDERRTETGGYRKKQSGGLRHAGGGRRMRQTGKQASAEAR